MKAADVISSLKARGVELWQESGALRYRARAGTLTEQERETLKRHKSAILQALAAVPPVNTAGADSVPVALHVEVTEPAARECRNCACFEPYPFEPILGSCYALQRMQHATSKPACFGCDNFESKEVPS